MDMGTAEERVARGAKFLDSHGPKDWHNEINTEKLDIASACDCVLGQICPDLLLVAAFSLAYVLPPLGYQGFNACQAEGNSTDAEAVKQAWIAEINRRKSKANS